MDLYSNPIYQCDIKHIAGLNLPWEHLSGTHLLISGASGMIGSVLVDALMKRNELYGDGINIVAVGRDEKRAKSRFKPHLNNPLFSFVTHDINNPLPELGAVDYVIHAASNTHPLAYATDPVGTITANVFGTYNMLNYAISHRMLRFILLSTVEIYGENTMNTGKFDETSMGYIDCNTTRAGYPEGKRTGEALCNAFAAMYGVDFVTARLCRVYGPSMLGSDSKAVAQFIKDAVAERDIVLKSMGNQFFSYCHVADAVSAILYIMLLGKSGEAYNVADDKSDITLKDFAELLASISGSRVVYEPPSALETSGFSSVTRALLDPSKLKTLGWTAHDTIKSGLGKTISVLKTMSSDKV